ncbi:RloB family protein [Rothia mucilaginosa]|uniref:RloB family protein n=1 Tax=Rothia mucilaginosa TaxID=43675 RepID=UPI00066E10FC|nr:RloB family protein [Rothia mucilaginosa]
MSNNSRFARDKRPSRAPKKNILICVEGEKTETDYFKLLGQYLKSKKTSVHFKVIPPKGTDPGSILKGCLTHKNKDSNKYESFFCVVDVDQHTNLEQALKEAEEKNILMVVTNIKFEVWLLWHMEDSPNGYMSNSDINNQVKTISASRPFMIGKNNKEIHPKFPIGKYDIAIKKAQRNDPNMDFNRKGPNPSSAMPLLIDKIING